MRFVPSSGVLLLAAAADLAQLVSANPYPRDDLHDAGYSYLMPRACDSFCGADNQFCCESGEYCTTLRGNVATCMGDGGYNYITTVWTETRTFTSTIMTYWEPAPEPTEGVDCIPQNDEQEACGPICCAGWQTCANSIQGQCSAKPGMGDGSNVVITTDGKVTTRYSAPFRITGTTTITTSGVSTATITSAHETESSDSDGIGAGGGGGGGGLSPGAIAGIVIGSLVGVALLMLLCFCCIARGLWNMIFGGAKKKKRVQEDVYEEGYSGHGRRDRHQGWFGFGGGRPSSAGGRSEKKSSGKKWLGLAGLAATLLALLNLRRDKKPSRAGSRYSNSYYSYSGSSNTHSSSSGRRTHRSRDSRGTRGTKSQYTRSPRR